MLFDVLTRGALFRRAWRLAVAALVAGTIVAAAWPEVARDGYSPDEEFTVFAVRGIVEHGLPLLPSGLLYDRGVGYSYAAWLASAGGSTELPAARTVSLAATLLALAALWRATRHVSGEAAAWLALALVASSVPFWVVATSARFYAPFLACYMATLAVLSGAARRDGGGHLSWSPEARFLLFALPALARFTHELAFTLALVPLVCAVLARQGARARRPWIAAALVVVAGLATAQATLFALHLLAPESGVTMIRRFFLWQVLNLLARPPLAAPVGVLLVVGLVVLIVRVGLPRPELTAPRRRLTLALAAIVLAWAAVTGPVQSLHYPLDLFWHVARTAPVLVLTLIGLLAARAWGTGGPWSPPERAVHLLWVGWVTFFGVIESGITVHYVLMPMTLMLAAVAVDATAVLRGQLSRATDARRGIRSIGFAAAAVVLLAVAFGQWLPHPPVALASARPTLATPPTLRQWASDARLVACTDELACLLLAGRVDRWLALDEFLRERFVVSRGGKDVGVYAGTPAVYRLSALLEEAAHIPFGRVLIVDVVKQLPVGSSAVFLERALDHEAMRATTRLETKQLRVLELSPVPWPSAPR